MNKILIVMLLLIFAGCSSSSEDHPSIFTISPTKLDEIGLVQRDNAELAMNGASYVGTEIISITNTLPVSVDNISVIVPTNPDYHYTIISSGECIREGSASYKVMPNSICRIKLLGTFDAEMQTGTVLNDNVTIKYSGNTVVIPLKITFMKAPDIQVNESSIELGAVKLGEVSEWANVTYRNMSNQNSDNMRFGWFINDTNGFESQHFESQTTCGKELAAGASCDLRVRFNPKTIKKHFQSYGFFVKNTQLLNYVPLNGDVVTRVFDTNGIGYNHDEPTVIATPTVLSDFVVTGNNAEGKINIYNDSLIMMNDLSISIISDDGRFSLPSDKSSCDANFMFFDDCAFIVVYNTENAAKGRKLATVRISGSNAPETLSIPVVFDYK